MEERRCIRRRISMLFFEGDMAAVRFMLVLAGFGVSTEFWLYGCKTYISCYVMEQLMPWQGWAIVWTSYTVLKAWRLLERKSRPKIALLVNTIGCFLFGSLATTLLITRWPHIPSLATTLMLASIWVLMRTAVNPGQDSFRSD